MMLVLFDCYQPEMAGILSNCNFYNKNIRCFPPIHNMIGFLGLCWGC